jgi:hypothetical protein
LLSSGISQIMLSAGAVMLAPANYQVKPASSASASVNFRNSSVPSKGMTSEVMSRMSPI